MANFDIDPSQTEVADGVQTVFGFAFSYRVPGDLRVFVDAVEKARPADWDFLTASTIEFTVAPVNGAVVEMRRDTDIQEPAYLFDSGIPFLPRFVDENNRQLLNGMQEAVHGTADTAAEALATAEEALGVAQEASDKVDAAVIESAAQLRLDLADPVDPDNGSELVAFRDVRAPAYLKTVSDIINGVELSMFRFIPKTMHADIRNRVGGQIVTANFQDAFAAIRPTGGSLFVPDGIYDIDDTLDFWTGPIRGFAMRGAALRATQLRWVGGTNKVMFTNEQPTANQFHYGVFFRDMEITARHGAITQPVVGTVGLHLEMAQHQWGLENLYFAGFDTNIDIGVHSEGGKINKVWTGYAGTGCNLYGDQADAIDLRGVWFMYNKFTGCRVSSPRPTFDNCMFVSQDGFSDPVNYTDILLGWQAIRPQDIGKSAFLTADKGNAAIKARIHNCNFEGHNGGQAILVQNTDVTGAIYDGLSFENNFFALYTRPTAIRWATPYNNVSSQFNKIESTNNTASLHSVTVNNQGLMEVNEPFVHKKFDSNAQFWRNGAKKEDFDRLPQLASSALFASPGWGVTNLGTGLGLTLVDLDYDGRNGIKVDYNNITPLAPFAFSDATCPAGMVYLDFDVEATGIGRIHLDARDAGNAVIFAKNSIRVGPSEKKRITVGFNNPALQAITVRVYLQDFVGSGSLTLGEVLFKHGDGAIRSFNSKDTATGLRFTTRNNQVFEGAMRVPRQRISDAGNFATGHWFTGDQVFGTISNPGGYAAGATSIVVASAVGMAIGDYMFFKGVTASGRSPIYQSTPTTGNKISNIVGTTITLATGLPFAMADGGRVLTTKVFREAASTLL